MSSASPLDEYARRINGDAAKLAQRLIDEHCVGDEDKRLSLLMALLQAAVAVARLSRVGDDQVRKILDNAIERVRVHAVDPSKAADA